MVLSDVSGEKLKNCTREMRRAFRDSRLVYIWNEQRHSYQFKTLETQTWSNQSLSVDGRGLATAIELNDTIEDVVMLILYGATDVHGALPGWIEERCQIGNLFGMKDDLARFIRERYIWVSRITGG